jgi:hypothetical protein
MTSGIHDQFGITINYELVIGGVCGRKMQGARLDMVRGNIRVG